VIRRIWDVTLTVRDLARAVRFYRDILGLQEKYEFRDYAGFDCGGVEIGIKTWGKLEKPREGEPCINFLVDDVEETCRKLSEKGVEILEGPQDTPWGGRYIVISDPDGNRIQLTEINWAKYFKACAG